MRRTLAVVVLVVLSLGFSGCMPEADGRPPPPPGGDDRPEYLVRDRGMRCAVAPCLSWEAVEVRTGEATPISEVDVSALGLDAEAEEQTRERLLEGSLHARGSFGTVPDAGPAGDGVALVVSEVVEPAP
jgi:hypothetical protein